MTYWRRTSGFTLLELLVALFITAILFAMGYSALTQAMNGRKEVEEQTARLTALQQTMRLLEQDFELLQPRPVRDPLGSGYELPFVLNKNASSIDPGSPQSVSAAGQGAALVSFTRGGWANPAGLPRSELQRVSYVLREGKLIRQYFPILDAPASVRPEEREMLDQVETLNVRVMDDTHLWYPNWPTPNMTFYTPVMLMRARPVAVEITIRLKDFGDLVRVIELAG